MEDEGEGDRYGNSKEMTFEQRLENVREYGRVEERMIKEKEYELMKKKKEPKKTPTNEVIKKKRKRK
jgi:hypothetical protein